MVARRIATFLSLVLLIAAQASNADDVTISGSDVSASAIQATISNNGGGKVTFATSHDLSMNQNLTDVTGIQVNSGVAADIKFGSNSFGVVFKTSGAVSIDLQGGGATLRLTGTSSSAGIALASSGQTLTLNGSIDGGAAATTLFIGNNTLQITAPATIDGTVSINGAGATLDVDADATIATLKDNGGTLAIDVADGTHLTATSPSLSGTTTLNGVDYTDSIFELGSLSTVNDLTVTGQATVQVDANTIFTTCTVASTNVAQFDIASGVAAVVSNPSMGGTVVLKGANSTSVLSLAGPDNVNSLLIDGAATLSVDAAMVFSQLSVTASGSAVYDQNTALTFITSLGVLTNGDLTFDIADGDKASVTNLATIDGDSVLELRASGGGSDDVVDFVGGLRLDGTSTLRFTNDSGRVEGSVETLNGNATIDVDGDAEIEMLTPTTGGTLSIADGKSIAFDNAITVPVSQELAFSGTTGAAAETVQCATVLVNGGTLRFGGDDSNALSLVGSIGTTAASTIAIDSSTSMTSLVLGVSSDISVAAGATLTTTLNVSTTTATLSGTGVISRVDMTTGKVLDQGGVTINDLRALPSGGTSTYEAAIGITSTVASLDNALTTSGDMFNKIGAGTLVVSGGLAGVFDNASGVVVDVDAGTLQVGSSAMAADNVIDIAFDDDDDLLSVDGATLTTFGDISGASGANTNLSIAADATLNLSGITSRTITQQADRDIDVLGHMVVNGANGSYSLADAHTHVFGDVDISSTSGLSLDTAAATLRFVTGSVVTLAGDATFYLNGQSAGTPISLDTLNSTGLFEIDRGDSANLSLKNTDAFRAVYSSDTGESADCDGVPLTGFSAETGSTNWLDACSDESMGGNDNDNDNANANDNDNGNSNGNENSNANGNDNSDGGDMTSVDVTCGACGVGMMPAGAFVLLFWSAFQLKRRRRKGRR